MQPRETTDELEITQLQYRYGRGVASRDVDAVVSCFTDDAHLDYDGVPPIDGRAEIRAFFETNLVGGGLSSHTPLVGPTVSTPVITNVLVDIAGDTAVATSTCLAIHAGPGDGRDEVVIRGTENHDELTRSTDGWRIRRRAHLLLWSFTVDGAVHGEAPRPR